MNEQTYITREGLKVLAKARFDGQGDFETFFAGYLAAWGNRGSLINSVIEDQDAKLADLRQRNEDTDALLLIARAERDTVRKVQEQLQDVVTAQEAEIARLRAALGNIQIQCQESHNANYPDRVAKIRGIVNELRLWSIK